MADIPERMRAIVLKGHGEMDQLEYHEDWPVPALDAGEVLIRVGACGLNNTDVNTRTGWYDRSVKSATTGGALLDSDLDNPGWGGAPISFPRIQGADVSGRVVAVGANVDTNLIGERVLVDTWVRDIDDPLDMTKAMFFGSEVDGGFAEFTKVPSGQAYIIKTDLLDAELATFATSYVTAENMLNRANVGANDTVLITGASGGVGSALIQLAGRRGAQTLALCSEDKAGAVKAIGPTAVLPRSPRNLSSAIKDAIGTGKVSVVADVVGGSMFGDLIDVLQRGGRYTCSGAIAGPIVELDLRTFYLNDLTFTGATIVPPGTFADLVGYIERGEIKPLLAAVYPLSRLHEAQQAFIDKCHVGNIVVTME